MAKNLRYYDIMTLQALMMQALATYNANALEPAMRAVDREMHKLLGQLQADNLGDMTKAELNAFLKDVRQTSKALLTQVSNDSTRRLQTFASTVLGTSALFLAAEDKPVKDLTPEEIVDRADRRPMADGNERDKLWPLWVAAAVRAYENAVRAAYTTNGTRAQVGEDWANATQKAWLQSVGIDKTSSTHIGNQVFLDLLGGPFDKYIWLSVIDNRTSDFCIFHNKRIYVFGKGPVPPGHWHCRAHIAPVVDGGGDVPAETLWQWWSRQDRFIKSIAIPNNLRGRYSIEKMTSEQLSKLTKVMTLSPEEMARNFERGLEHYGTPQAN